jgi:cytidine deaminase
VENAAFNPSLSPLQAALAQWLSEGLSLDSITRAVLVESSGSVSLQPTTRSLLRAVAPALRLEIVEPLRPR